MTNPGPFLWNGSSKIQFYSDFSTFSVRGCWGQAMLLFWKQIHETQNLLPPKATRHHNSIKLLVFLPLRADLLCTLHYETPCRKDYQIHFINRKLPSTVDSQRSKRIFGGSFRVQTSLIDRLDKDTFFMKKSSQV